jgi:hypothetical protein
MENQEHNNLSELDQLKAQYETLKQQFDKQEIINDRLMKSSIKRSTDFYKRYRTIQFMVYPLMVIVGLLTIKWLFGNSLSMSLFWVAFCVICFVAELWMTKMVRFKTLENNDLLTLSNHARSFKKLYAIFVVSYAVSVTIFIVGWLISEIGSNGYLPNFGAFIIVFCLALVAIVSLGIAEVRYKTGPCDEIIRQIEAFETTTNKETGLNKKQQWFCIAMIVAFVGLDIWAYTIVGTYLKLPPMWRTVEYVRAADDYLTEGKLAIWEVFADTVVPEKDVPELRQILNNDSYILMEGRQEEKMEIGDDAMHSRRQDENNPKGVQLYLLKKNSQEGPAISSMALEGKPIVQRVDVTKPPKYPSNGSVPMIVWLTPEAGQLWLEFTKHLTGKRGAVSIDGVVVQEWKIMSNLENGCFFIMREWSSKEELEAFCEQLIRQ